MRISKCIVLAALLGTMSHQDVVSAVEVSASVEMQKHHHKKHKNKSKKASEDEAPIAPNSAEAQDKKAAEKPVDLKAVPKADDYEKIAAKKAEEKAEKDCQDKKGDAPKESAEESAAKEKAAEDDLVKAADKIHEQKEAAKEKAKEVTEKLKVKEAKEEKAAFDKVLANKKAEVLGVPVIETPKPEVKPLMTSDQAIKMVK